MAAKCSKTRTRRIKGKRQISNLVPGWVFVRAPEAPELFALWHHRVKHTKHVKSFLTSGRNPLGTSDTSIDELRSRVALYIAEEARRKAKRKWAKGDKAKIASGALAGRNGEVKHIRGQRVRLEVWIMGQFREVNTTVEQLEQAA